MQRKGSANGNSSVEKRGPRLFENKDCMTDRAWPVLAVLLLAVTGLLPSAVGAPLRKHSTATRVASVATVTTRDLGVAVVAYRLNEGAAPTAEVRLAIEQHAGQGRRERGEMRLDETYFWRTVTAPRSVCRLEVSPQGSLRSVRPHVTVQLLVTPSLGCGRVHRFPLSAR
jgi:hypothetical protein